MRNWASGKKQLFPLLLILFDGLMIYCVNLYM